MTEPGSTIHPGTKIGGYVVERLLGHGGMGDVYLARDLAQDRPVALKILPPDAAHDVRRSDRLNLEGRVLQSLRHPNICSVYEVGEDGGRVFLAMEYLEGRTLHDVALSKRPAPERVIEIGCQLAAALEAARHAGVVHRDLKGANVMVLPGGDIKVLDFGLAKFAPTSDHRLLNPVGRPTDPGLIFGTAEFMSPEQALGREVDHRSDLFSMGVIFYELLTGKLPFKGDTRMELFWAILNTQPTPVTELNPSVPQPLAELVEQLLQKDAKARPQSAERVLERLKELLPKPEDQRKEKAVTRRRWIARLGGSALGISLTLAMLPLLLTVGNWADAVRENSALNAGSIWVSSELIYDAAPVIDRAVNPAIAWVANDGRILYNTRQRHGQSALWLKLPSKSDPELIISDAGSAAVIEGSEDVFFVRSGQSPGLYRTTFEGGSLEKVAEGPVLNPKAAKDGQTVAFVRPVFGGYTIWAVPAGGGEPYQLSPMIAKGVPYVSEDLKRVAVLQASDVLICDLPGCGNQETFAMVSLLGWTRDGASLVHQGAPGIANIWLTRVSDGVVTQLTRFNDQTASSIGWSADGHRIAVTRHRTLRDFDWFGLFRR